MNFFNFKPNTYKELGYITDQKGIQARYRREKENWNEHLENSKNYIISFCNNINSENIAILGSGWLLDVPIEFLCHRFKTVYLIDVNHPAKIQTLKNEFKNIEFITDDITGGIAQFAQANVINFKKNKIKTEIEDYKHIKYKNKIDNCALISLNILNQLDIIIVDYIEKFNMYSNDELLQLRKIIQYNHLDLLLSYPSCIISDIEEIIINKNNIIEKTNSLVHCMLPKGKNSKEWIWKFDTKMRYIDNKKIHFKVYATELIQ